jgi:hypothetical protein
VINLQTHSADGRRTVQNWTDEASHESTALGGHRRRPSRLDNATALPWNGKETDMVRSLETRIMQNGSGWYWEVTQGDEVIARGVADTHAGARAEASKVSPQETETWEAGTSSTSSDRSTTFRY